MDNDGDSFEDCVTKCTSNGDDRTSTRRTQTLSNRSTIRSQTSPTAAVTESDCHCYCSMVHDPCNEEPTAVTGMY